MINDVECKAVVTYEGEDRLVDKIETRMDPPRIVIEMIGRGLGYDTAGLIRWLIIESDLDETRDPDYWKFLENHYAVKVT